MICIRLNEPDFEYDIYSLFGAFYPGEPIVISEDEAVLERKKREACETSDEPLSFCAQITYEHRDRENVKEIVCRFLSDLDGEILDEKCIPVSYRKEDPKLRKETKDTLKRMIYGMLRDRTGQTLPWGTLTGIRPTKIAMEMLDRGCTPEEIARSMEETYLTSKEKREICIGIAQKEKSLLSAFPYRDGYSLYIGIPFCPTRCLYCSFTSYPLSIWQNKVDEYLEALKKELSEVGRWMKNVPLHTVYMGGGTPTSLTAEQMDGLLSFLEDTFDLSHVLEFCVEGGRPDSFSKDKLAAMKRHPVSRISINPQTMNEETLRTIGRAHSVEDVKRAFAMAREYDFDNINMDIILGLPGEGEAQICHTLDEIATLCPESLTVHSLAVKRAAKLAKERKKYTMQNTNEWMQTVGKYATMLGMEPYYLYRQKNMAGNLENIGYARLGREGLYNILIMEEKQTIVSCGAGGLTKVIRDGRPLRIENVKDVGVYRDRLPEMIERKRAVLTAG